MKTLKTALLTLAIAGTPALAQDCTPPEAPTIADGSTSTMEDMIASQGALKAFQAANAEYRECLTPAMNEAQASADAEDASDEAKAASKAINQAHDSSIDREQELANQFNAEVKEYYAANPKEE